MDKTKDPLFFFCGALLGSALGAAAALYLSPELRAKTQEYLPFSEKKAKKRQLAHTGTSNTRPKKIKVPAAHLSRKKAKKQTT